LAKGSLFVKQRREAPWDAGKFMTISVPGRVNLIGEHIDYHDLPVLPMAIQRRVSITFDERRDPMIQASSHGYDMREFALSEGEPFPPGDWGNYLKAAAQLVTRRWYLSRGLNAAIESDLPVAAGLSSSSALMTGVALALLRVNDIKPTFEDLMELLPDGEQFVGTRGGGMDHAAVLASHAGSALLLRFAPLKIKPIQVPPGWAFIVAHSLTVAEKSGPAKEQYNSRRIAGMNALRKLGLCAYQEAVSRDLGKHDVSQLSEDERGAFLHVTSEAKRVEAAETALRNNRLEEFGCLLSASHASLRDQLRVSNPALDELVECALACGALGARLTGAGFGGCAILLCRRSDRERVSKELIQHFYAGRADFVPGQHLIFAEPSAGALSA
jgi:galactokinase